MACLSVGLGMVPKSFQTISKKSEAKSSAGAISLRRSNLRMIANSSSSSSSSSKSGEDEEMKMKIKYEGTRRREKEMTEMIEKKIREAEEVCGEDKMSDGCKVAWDEVEEISAAKSHLRLQLMHSGDPLENFCHQHPETDECRIYQD